MEVTRKIYVILESGIKLPLLFRLILVHAPILLSRDTQIFSNFGKQESTGNRENQIRNQAKILHDSESRRRELISLVAGPSMGIDIEPCSVTLALCLWYG